MPISGSVLGAWSLEDRRRLLVLTGGRLLVHSLQTCSSVTLQSVAGVVSAHPAAGDTVLAVTEAGDLYTLDIAADTASLVTVPAARVSAVSGTAHHTCLLDPAGHVWARGAPPQVWSNLLCEDLYSEPYVQVGVVSSLGHVDTASFCRVRVSPGCRVTQVVTGADFTAVVVRRRLAGDRDTSPVRTPDTEAAEGLVCPLGLHLSSPGSSHDLPAAGDQVDGGAVTGAVPGSAVSSVVSQVTSQVRGHEVMTISVSC